MTLRGPLGTHWKRQMQCRQVRMFLAATTFISKENTRPSALQQKNLQEDQDFQEPLRSQASLGDPEKKNKNKRERFYTLSTFLIVYKFIGHWALGGKIKMRQVTGN